MVDSNITFVWLQHITNWTYAKKETKKHDKKQETLERNMSMNISYTWSAVVHVQIVADRLCVKV